jgi:DNA (cytosine-5)-methyltransferase 1
MLPAQLVTGGNNTPFVVEQTPFCKSARPRFKGDAPTYIPCNVTNTLNTFDVGETRANELVVEKQPIYCLQGNGIDRADTAGCNGKGWTEDVSYTLNTIDRPAVSYDERVWAIGNGQVDQTKLDVIPGALNCMHDQQAVLIEKHTPIAIDRAFFNQGKNAQYDPQTYEDGTVPTVVARGPSAVCHEQPPHYIVRRLTPTECARLQGFPDEHGHPDVKTELTDEEYAFWLGVRNTHAEINGKPQKTYTREQMLKWYNSLHTDSAEYKMWGNGIALPCAVFVMQGIAEELKKQKQDLKG